MRTWLALLLAPLLVLGQQSAMYSLTTPSCRQQTTFALHAIAASTLVAVIVFTVLAWSAWRDAALPGDPAVGAAEREDTRALRRRRFVAAMATAVGALSALLALTMWMPAWVLPPCVS
jgi:heme/copper-type cytochrome/quinol oxidase subunit 2